MPLDRPVYPGEAEIDLTTAALSSAACVAPALALDDDPATAAVFGAGAAFGLGPALSPVQAARLVYATGKVYTYPPTNAIDGDPGTPVDLYLTGSFQADYLRLDMGRETTVGAVRLAGVTAAVNPLAVWVSDNPAIGGSLDPQPATLLTGPGTNPLPAGSDYVFTAPAPGATGRYLFVRQTYINGGNSSCLIGEVTYQAVVSGPPPRFLRVDWGYDAFVSRIRLAYAGPGAANAGVDYESSLSLDEFLSLGEDGRPAADVALSYIPSPADGNAHEVVFSPPVLGRGVVFYPDALLAAPSALAVDLYTLSVYQDVSQGVLPMANPTVKQARVGCSGLVITPRAYTTATSYPFAQALATALQSIQSLNFSSASKLARETGGESVHQLNGYETDREVKCKVSVERHDYLALQNILAGTLVVSPASANGPETQYHAPGYTDREPYFSLVAQSANGDPTALFVMPKCKVDGNLTQDLERDKVTTLEVDFVLFWDSLYTRQDGQLGGIYEQIFSNGGLTALHS